jgi:hypothetical protein
MDLWQCDLVFDTLGRVCFRITTRVNGGLSERHLRLDRSGLTDAGVLNG